jgi:two-component system response regulator GlrR
MTETRILVLEIEPSEGATMSLRAALEPTLSVNVCESRLSKTDALIASVRLLEEIEPDLVFISIGEDARETASKIVSAIHDHSFTLPIFIIGNAAPPGDILALLQEGAADFITLPVSPADIVPRVRRLLDVEEKVASDNLRAELGLRNLVGNSQAFVAEISKIPIIARCDATVLIGGETGTGKELCARAIHYLSPRAKQPFVPINCGAIPPDLAENELFGHERGAFTGADSNQTGLIHEANRGTLFLDEIDCLSPLTQAKLLRFLQDKEYRPLGSSKARRADVRVIAASNSDIAESVREGRLRKDLYYRLNVIPLSMVPLRERSDDIALLASHFLEVYSAALKKRVSAIDTEAISKLLLYRWPGNVRELEHVIERAVVMCESTTLTENDIILSESTESATPSSFQESKARVVSQFELNYIKGLLTAYRGNITRAAKAANKNRRAFFELIRKHRIDVTAFKQGTTQ